MSTTVNTVEQEEKEIVELPDFLSPGDTERFVHYLKANIHLYGVKTLLYHSEMILNHHKRIAARWKKAEQILIRVNGSITPIQKEKYQEKTQKAIARKFYGLMNDYTLRNELLNCKELDAEEVSNTLHYGVKEEWVEMLVRAHLLRNKG